MTRYADPHRCPDCGASITSAGPSCPACALSLRGDAASRLFQTLTLADGLLATLRGASVPTAAAAVKVAAAAPAPAAAPFDPAPFPARPIEAPPRRGLSSASVPQILLALGAGCLLVAALVFLAVTWRCSGSAAAPRRWSASPRSPPLLTAWMSRRGLRAAAEALALVGYGLLTLDVVGADSAGWFGGLSDAGVLLVVGAVLVGSGVAGTLVVRRTSASSLTTGEVVAVIGTGLAALAFSVGRVAARLAVSGGRHPARGRGRRGGATAAHPGRSTSVRRASPSWPGCRWWRSASTGSSRSPPSGPSGRRVTPGRC